MRCEKCGTTGYHHTSTHEMWDREYHWRTDNGYRESSSPACPLAVTKGRVPTRHYCGDERHPMQENGTGFMDHGRVWLRPDGSKAILAHVYTDDPSEVGLRAMAWAGQCGLRVRLGSSDDDWYFPGHAVPFWFERA